MVHRRQDDEGVFGR